ncbi:thioesterase [Streptomyces sp. SID14478]|uniref:thioesterase II family protein n=1 Tax=Streptomyces sp. SID14478 TaxID=2706073 RepID=UPI0013DAC4B1|nr:alpha/beta fold hydrolase [Streptomyces sp. SID14478]NEB74413.1 thioesterase [Streptomyces sp. SID14478]
MTSLLPEPARAWLRPIADGTTAPAGTVVCLPHAGGSVGVFSTWAGHLPDGLRVLGVQYPGRADRNDEPLPEDLPSLAQHIAFSLQWLNGPYTLFGHSMGALLAYETCLKLAGLGIAGPEHLVVSASPPPDHAVTPGRDDPGNAAPDLPDSLAQEPEVKEHFEQLLAQDLRLLQDYEPSGQPVDTPLTCLYNTDDPEMNEENADGWQKFTTSAFRSTELPGGHFACFLDPEATWTVLEKDTVRH